MFGKDAVDKYGDKYNLYSETGGGGLDRPYFGGARPIKASVEEHSYTDRETEEEVKWKTIDVVFELLDEGWEGITYTYSFRNPRKDIPDFDANRFKAQVSFMGLEMLRYFADGERKDREKFAEKALSVKKWSEFMKAFIKAFNKCAPQDRTDIKIKVLGNVYEGKTSINFPMYRFMADDRSEEELKLGPKEREMNKKYMKVKFGDKPSEDEELFDSEDDNEFIDDDAEEEDLDNLDGSF
jgi:hypothetical protein